jgi:hypothetical protein
MNIYRRAKIMANIKKLTTEYTGEEEAQETREAVNILDLLLGSDIGEIKLPTKKVEITRLSKLYGTPFEITCRALSPDKYEEVQEMAIKVQGKDVDLDINLLQLFVVIEGVVDEAGKPMMKNKELMKKFKAQTPKELTRKIFLSGEITNIYGEISELSGFGDEAIKEVKN